MAEVVLFHHAHGLTDGCLAIAEELRAAGHVVHAPDLYDGKTFARLDEGVGYAKQVGFDTILERGRLAGESLPDELVYAGLSLFCTRAIDTCSPTAACPTTTRTPPLSSNGACSTSSASVKAS